MIRMAPILRADEGNRPPIQLDVDDGQCGKFGSDIDPAARDARPIPGKLRETAPLYRDSFLYLQSLNDGRRIALLNRRNLVTNVPGSPGI
jgi:hypothetical protein